MRLQSLLKKSQTLRYHLSTKMIFLFKEGETIVAGESDVEGVIQTLDSQSFDISQNFVFDDGQEGTIYNIGSLREKQEFQNLQNKSKFISLTVILSPQMMGILQQYLPTTSLTTERISTLSILIEYLILLIFVLEI